MSQNLNEIKKAENTWNLKKKKATGGKGVWRKNVPETFKIGT